MTNAPPKRRWFQFRLRTLLIAVLVLSLGLSWLAPAFRPIIARRPLASDTSYERYFMIPTSENSSEAVEIRKVAVVEGGFTKDTWLTASLVLVTAGKVEPKIGFMAGRSPNRIGGDIWTNMEVTLAIGEAHASSGRRTFFGCSGATRATGSGTAFTTDCQIVAKKLLPGRLVSGHERIVYMEGNKSFSVTPDMPTEEFAQRNNGKFLVVVARLD